jgi:hypothetical protein
MTFEGAMTSKDKKHGERRKHCLAAVSHGCGRDYEALAEFFAEAIETRLTEGR